MTVTPSIGYVTPSPERNQPNLAEKHLSIQQHGPKRQTDRLLRCPDLRLRHAPPSLRGGPPTYSLRVAGHSGHPHPPTHLNPLLVGAVRTRTPAPSQLGGHCHQPRRSQRPHAPTPQAARGRRIDRRIVRRSDSRAHTTLIHLSAEASRPPGPENAWAQE